MSYYQIFAQIMNSEVQNVVVFDNYSIANRITKLEYGENAFAVQCNDYKVAPGCKYINGTFYDKDGTKECERNLTINSCHEEMTKLQEQYKADLFYVAMEANVEL